ncbi:hypothetical protein GH714_030826 [Hevea brasiliensis]|uniref:26S proteasome regulatory subunit Rpn6 N-terminal domain-containing protein n=1 Tax=Hevea brasiliensis TaxID=3981 RepID=A0A6A6LFB1_HEVBR|nr:hypothetical protein GH714_030826 [Hevea brasiliensis]
MWYQSRPRRSESRQAPQRDRGRQGADGDKGVARIGWERMSGLNGTEVDKGFLNPTSDKKGVDPRDKCGLSCKQLALEAKTPSESISIYYRMLENPSSSPDSLRIKEQAITNLSDLLRQENRAEELRSLLTQLRPFFALIPKAKTAKIVRGIIDAVAKIPGTSDLQISLCKEMVQWTRAEKRTFLRQRVEARLAAL